MADELFEGDIVVPIDRGRRTGTGIVFSYVDQEIGLDDFVDRAGQNAAETRARFGDKVPRFLVSVMATRSDLLLYKNPGPLNESDKNPLCAAVARGLRGRPWKKISEADWALLAYQFRAKLAPARLQPVMWHGKAAGFRTYPEPPRPKQRGARREKLARALCRAIDAGGAGLPNVEPEVFVRRVSWRSYGLPLTPFELAVCKNPPLARQMLDAGAVPGGDPASSAAILHAASVGAGSLELFGRLLELGFDPDGPVDMHAPPPGNAYSRSLLARLLDRGAPMLPFVERLFVHPGFDRRVWPEARGAPLQADEYAWWRGHDEIVETLRGWKRWDGTHPARRAWVGAVVRAANAKT